MVIVFYLTVMSAACNFISFSFEVSARCVWVWVFRSVGKNVWRFVFICGYMRTARSHTHTPSMAALLLLLHISYTFSISTFFLLLLSVLVVILFRFVSYVIRSYWARKKAALRVHKPLLPQLILIHFKPGGERTWRTGEREKSSMNYNFQFITHSFVTSKSK